MVTFTVDNNFTHVDRPDLVREAIDRFFVIKKDGFVRGLDFKEYQATGKAVLKTKYHPETINLYNLQDQIFPTGRLGYVVDWAYDHGVPCQVLDTRKKPERHYDITYVGPVSDGSNGFPARPYQERAPQLVREHGGRGILWHATASGKTNTAARIIADLGVNTLYVVPSLELLDQTAEGLEKALAIKNGSIGKVGDGCWNPQAVTIATMATLWSRYDTVACKELLANTECVIYDECFIPGTKVDGKNIEDIKVGDAVTAFDDNTFEISSQKVTHVFKTKLVGKLVTLKFGSTVVTCTYNHPICTVSGWKAAGMLSCKDRVLCTHGSLSDSGCYALYTVDTLTVHEAGSDGTYGGLCPEGYVYNLEVANKHTYVANGVIVHNCHHISSKDKGTSTKDSKGKDYSVNSWYVLAITNSAYYRVGLTGTPGKDLEQKRCFLEAGVGRVIDRVPARQLIDAGIISDVEIHMHTIKHVKRYPDFHTARREGVLLNEKLNEYIVQIAIAEYKMGRSVLLLTESKLHQGPMLSRMFETLGMYVPFVSGDTADTKRKKAREDFKAGTQRLLIGSVYGEGVDFPALDSGILCSGMADEKRPIQFLGRVLRKAKGKGMAHLHDFRHQDKGVLQKHSNSRLNIYVEEEIEKIITHTGITV